MSAATRPAGRRKPQNRAAHLLDYSCAEWFLGLRETSNDAFVPLFADEHRFLVLCGGGGSGKSIFAGRKLIERAVAEPGHRFLVCRKVGKTLRDSCFRQLCGQLSEHYPQIGAKINRSDLFVSLPNGSEFIFTGLDDVEKLKSIYNVTGVWIEEASEIEESDLNQLNIRLRGQTKHYQQIILTFNPVSVMHWLKKRFFDRSDPDARTHRSTYRDNRFLPEENRRVLEKFKNTDEYFYTVYCLGEWGVTGRSVFNAMAVTERLALKIKPLDRGMFRVEDNAMPEFGEVFQPDFLPAEEYEPGRRRLKCEWTSDGDGYIRLYELPEEGVPYVIGGDTAGDGSDSFVAQVIDNRDGRQVAILRHTFDEDLYARQVYALGMYYNAALVGIECNFSSYPIRMLQQWRYPNLYVRETFDEYTGVPKKSFGFRTDPKSRPVMLANLITALRDDVSLVSDEDTLTEMLTFVRDESFRPAAEAGAHDDCIMALAIAHQIRDYQASMTAVPAVKRVEWTRSMLEDWHKANAEERAYLAAKYGYPSNA